MTAPLQNITTYPICLLKGPFKMKTKIAVIGSNSFSGSDFIDLLLKDKDNSVIGISRSPEKSPLFLLYKRHKNPHFKFYQMDLNENMPAILALLDSFEPDYVVNFSAQSEVAPSWDTPWDWYRTNVVALSRLSHHLKDAKYVKRYVHISSPEVYGSCNDIKEDAQFNPSTPYATSKAAADMHLSTYVKQYQFPLVTVRSTNVYGSHQQLHKLIPKSICSIKAKLPIPLDGAGIAVKSYIHIRDISRGELLIMKKGKIGEIYHLSPDNGVAVRDVVKMICEMMGANFNGATQERPERPGQDPIYTIDSTKARKELGWGPQVSLSDGINGVIEWVNLYWDEIKAQPLTYIHKP